MKKILILVMYCNHDFFINEESLVQETWASNILKHKYPNIEFFSYTSSNDDKYHIDYNRHHIYIPCDDSLNGTAEKTIKCFKLIEKLNIEYDYIFRTNTSTYINVEILNRFVQTLYNDEILWSGISFASPENSGPYKYCFYSRGSALLISHNNIKNIIDKNTMYTAFDMDTVKNESLYTLDDACMGLLFNAYLFSKQLNHTKYYKTFGVVSIHSELTEIDDPSELLSMSYRVYNDDYDVRLYLESLRCKSIFNNLENKEYSFDLYQTLEYVNDDYIASSIHDLVKQHLIDKLKEMGEIPYLEK